MMARLATSRTSDSSVSHSMMAIPASIELSQSCVRARARWPSRRRRGQRRASQLAQLPRVLIMRASPALPRLIRPCDQPYVLKSHSPTALRRCYLEQSSARAVRLGSTARRSAQQPKEEQRSLRRADAVEVDRVVSHECPRRALGPASATSSGPRRCASIPADSSRRSRVAPRLRARAGAQRVDGLRGGGLRRLVRAARRPLRLRRRARGCREGVVELRVLSRARSSRALGCRRGASSPRRRRVAWRRASSPGASRCTP